MKKFIISICAALIFIVLISSEGLAYTPPNGNSVNFSLCSGYVPPSGSSINFTLGTDEGCNTCTPPAINNNWTVLWSDNCTLSTNTNLGIGKLILYGTSQGRFTLNANLTINGTILNPSSGSKFILNSGGKLIFK